MMRRLASLGLMLFAVLAMSAQEIQMKLTVEDGVVLVGEDGTEIVLNGVYTTRPDAFKQIEFKYVPIDGLDHVDLGLSVEWATINYYETTGQLFPWQSTDVVSRSWGYDGNWRMPTKAELQELIDGCNWEKGTNDEGQNGFWVSNRNDSSKKIFLPVTGVKESADDSIYDAESIGNYWSADAYDNNKGYYMELDFDRNRQRIEDANKVYYMAIRPVWTNTTVKLTASQVERTYNSATIEIKVDGEEQDYNDIQSIAVVCNNEEKNYSLARTVRAIFDGLEADTNYPYTVTATLSKGGSVSFSSTVKTDPIPEVLNDSCPAPSRPVDLGLPSGTKWSPWNMGAKAPTEYGRYCGWGDKTGWYQELNRVYYADGKDILNIATTEYDIATYQWQGEWRMPTIADFKELYTHCPPKLVAKGDQHVLVFKNQDERLSQDSLIVPLVGYKSTTTHEVKDTEDLTYNYYWTAESAGNNPYRITLGTFLIDNSISAKPRYELYAIRPVYGPLTTGGGSNSGNDDNPQQPNVGDWKEILKIEVDANGYETAVPADGVDMGLPSGTKWAAWNVGAMGYGDLGKYYAWGETAVREIYTKDNYESIYKGKQCYELDENNDVAHVLWGDEWQIPTPDDFYELFEPDSDGYKYVMVEWLDARKSVDEGCMTDAVDEKFRSGYKITSKANPNNFIFLPAGGYKGDEVANNPPTGRYWANAGTQVGDSRESAEHQMFTELIKPETQSLIRFLGSMVRPVKHKK